MLTPETLAVLMAANETVLAAEAGLNTKGIVDFVITYVVPLIAAFVAIGIMARANKGDVSGSTNSMIVIIIACVVLVGTSLFIAAAKQFVGFAGA